MIKRIFLVLIGICVFYYAIKINSFEFENTFSLSNRLLKVITIQNIFICLGFYFVGIFGRSLRLFYISDKINISIKKLLYLQTLSTSMQLALPFRLGDGARIYIFKNYLKGIPESAFIFIIEKVLDSFTLISILILMLWSNEKFLNLIADSRFIILASILLSTLYVLPDFLEIVYRNLLVREGNSRIKILFLKISRDILLARQKTIKRVKGKVLNLICISYVIWAFDCLSFSFIASALKQEYIFSFLMGPLCALSGFLPSPPLGIYGSVNIGLYWAEKLSGISNISLYSSIYSLLIYGSVVLISMILFLYVYFFRNKKIF